MADTNQTLADIANKMRIASIKMTTASKSGHPTSCSSMADLLSVIFFHPEAGLRMDPTNPRNLGNDKFILSKGHAAPILYAAWAEAGHIEKDDLMNLRKIDSDLEGHPTPRLDFCDVATGSLGQGLNAAAGMAYSMKFFEKRDTRVFCLMGDGEMAEGSNWEAMNFASHYNLDNLIAIVDVNRLGQSAPTAQEHDLAKYKARFEAFGFHAQVVDGHDVNAIGEAIKAADANTGSPSVLIAKTFKGKDCTPTVENVLSWHGKPLGGQETDALTHLESLIKNTDATLPVRPPVEEVKDEEAFVHTVGTLNYKKGDMIATRATFGDALKRLGDANNKIIGVDADVKNSTMTIKLKEAHPDQFIDCFIAEQHFVGAAIGACKRGYIPFCSTFAAFFTRAADHIRMSEVSFTNVKFVGTHCGVSIGLDGPSQMGLEDLGLFRALPNAQVFYPSDAVSMEHALVLAANYNGNVYIRANRPATQVIYDNDETFEAGQSKVVRQTDNDKLVIVGAGITLEESLHAHDTLAAEGINVTIVDLFSVKPIDSKTIVAAAKKAGSTVLVVEDHYQEGGMAEAIHHAVGNEGVNVHSIAVNDVPRSGQPQELLELFGIDRNGIIKKVKELLA